jgi:hypothetical protein
MAFRIANLAVTITQLRATQAMHKPKSSCPEPLRGIVFAMLAVYRFTRGSERCIERICVRLGEWSVSLNVYRESWYLRLGSGHCQTGETAIIGNSYSSMVKSPDNRCAIMPRHNWHPGTMVVASTHCFDSGWRLASESSTMHHGGMVPPARSKIFSQKVESEEDGVLFRKVCRLEGRGERSCNL